jgi:hypothetical protein
LLAQYAVGGGTDLFVAGRCELTTERGRSIGRVVGP